MFKILCFKPSINTTFSMRVDASLPMFPCPMIFLFALSPKVTLSYLSPCKENKLRFISGHVF